MGRHRVALGHQADDQAETVLYRIVRGTGIAGLAGIPYRRDIFVRPLLDVTRAQILRYLRRRSIAFVDDPSNADDRFARARIRHRILPALAKENPRVAEALRALAAAARGRGGIGADAGVDRETVSSLSRRAAATVARLASRGGTANVDVAGGRRVEISYGKVRVEKRAAAGRHGRGRARRQPSSSMGRAGTAGRPRAPSRCATPQRAAARKMLRRRRIRRRSARVAAGDAGAPPRRPDAAARRARQPQAFRPHDRREDRAAGSWHATGRDHRGRRGVVRARAAASRSRPSQRDHPASHHGSFRTGDVYISSVTFAATVDASNL